MNSKFKIANWERCCLADCHKKWDFAYTCDFEDRSRIEGNAFTYSFGRFSKETRLNRFRAGNQDVTNWIMESEMPKWQLCLAKSAISALFCTLFDVWRCQFSAGEKSIAACGVANSRVLRWQTPRAALANSVFWEPYFGILQRVQK